MAFVTPKQSQIRKTSLNITTMICTKIAKNANGRLGHEKKAQFKFVPGMFATMYTIRRGQAATIWKRREDTLILGVYKYHTMIEAIKRVVTIPPVCTLLYSASSVYKHQWSKASTCLQDIVSPLISLQVPG